MAEVELRQVSVVKGTTTILDRIDLCAADGEILGIIGESGSGKTTLLRAVAGLDELARGAVLIGGVDQRHADRRDIAMVFQENVLFPHRNVERNVAFPLEVRDLPREEIDKRVWAEGRALHIEDLMARNPRELSAGQQQLVQIARAMVRAPAAFLMDEPLAMLDRRVRIRMRAELKLMQRGYGVTTLYSTNDPLEAMSLADRIAVLENGRIGQLATPYTLYREPVDVHVAQLMGPLSLLDVVVEPDREGSWLVHPTFRLRAWAPVLGRHAGGTLRMGLRPEDIVPADVSDATVTIDEVERHVQLAHGTLDSDAVTLPIERLRSVGRVTLRIRDDPPRPGDRVGVRLGRYLLFDPTTGSRLEA